MNNPAEVTIIIATYNRPKVLAKAIQSVQYQTFSNWRLLVIGDNCSESTKELMDSITDERISYYNNPLRFGEQTGGNSIGIALADTEFIAFLNHDDLWTPDHLETALQQLKKSKDDFYIGRSIFSNNTIDSVPVLNEVNHINRKPHWIFLGKCMLFEPCSTWVLRTKKAKKIGYWKQRMETYRIPSQEYIMRAWHKKAKIIFGKKITCIMLTQHNNPDLRKNSEKYAYDYSGPDHDYMLDMLKNRYDEFKIMSQEGKIEPQKFEKVRWITKAPDNLKEAWKALLFHLMVHKYASYFYYATGIDSLSIYARLMGVKKTAIQKKIKVLEQKTGENKIEKRNMEEVIDLARKNFSKKNDNT